MQITMHRLNWTQSLVLVNWGEKMARCDMLESVYQHCNALLVELTSAVLDGPKFNLSVIQTLYLKFSLVC